MSSAPGTAPRAEIVEYVESWKKIFSDALSKVAGEAVAIEQAWKQPEGIAAVSEKDFTLQIKSSGSCVGTLGVRLMASDALRLCGLIAGAEPAAELGDEQRRKLREWFRQLATEAAASLKEKWGEVALEVAAGAVEGGFEGWLQCHSAKLGALTIGLRLDSPLTDALAAWHEKQAAAVNSETATTEAGQEKPAAAPAEVVAPATEGESAATEPGATPSEATAEATAAAPVEAPPPEPEQFEPLPEGLPGEPGNLDLLLDVELGVTLRFGERRMLLREVLELNAGAVIELDRLVQEPVDLLLDGKLIARGQVVVVDGNYGLRVTEIAEPATRPQAGAEVSSSPPPATQG